MKMSVDEDDDDDDDDERITAIIEIEENGCRE